MLVRGSHSLEKVLENQICLEKYWKNIDKGFEKSLNFTFAGGFNTVFGDLNQYKTVVSLFGAAYAAPNKGTTILYFAPSKGITILYLFSKTNILLK